MRRRCEDRAQIGFWGSPCICSRVRRAAKRTTSGTGQFPDKESEEILFLLWTVFEERMYEVDSLCADIGERVACEFLAPQKARFVRGRKKDQGEKAAHLQDLQNTKEPLLQPVLKKPHEQMFVRDRRIREWLVPKVPVIRMGSSLRSSHSAL
jgi:hypothetical protein